MFKVIKKSLLVLSLFICVFSVKANASTQTYTQANQIAEQCFRGYNSGVSGPISITKGVFTENGTSKTVYLIALSGTEFVTNQSTGVITDLLSGFEQDSPYLLQLVSVVQANIPKGSNLIIAGHSLGGMIAQQASGNSGIKDYYNVLNVVTFGSPLINPFGREGTIRRLGDTTDWVPYLSAMGTVLLPWQVAGLNKEDGGYSNAVTAHLESYLRSDIWGSYDVVGNKGGSATLKFDPNTSVFYKAPTNS